jgi:hypothetical protein
MSADHLPDRPNLDHLKHQARDLQRAQGGTLRDAQRSIARRYGFASWDALRDHVNQVTGAAPAEPHTHAGIDYEHFVRDTIALGSPLTRETARGLAERGVTGVKVDAAIPPGALALLAEIPTLQRLDLSEHTELTDHDVAFLARMPQLTAVAFARWGRVGDGAVAALAGKPGLSRVMLGPGLTDAGVEKLRDFPALAAPLDADSLLSISSARTLTDRALAAIGTLQGVVGLDVHLSVFGSPLYTAAGVAHLKKMGSLESLNYHGQLVTDAVLREIAAIPRLRWLHAQDVASGDDGFIALGQCTTLETAALRFCHGVTNRGVAALSQLPRLESLNVGGHRLTDDAFAPLAGARALRELSPSLSRDGAFVHIARIPHLERLVNMYNRSTTDVATRHLAAHPALARYSAFGTQITDASLRILAGLPSLEAVELDNLFGITDTGLLALARAPKLQRLSVDTCAGVNGEWLKSVPARLAATFTRGNREYAEFYRAETMMDHPELPMPDEVPRPAGQAPADVVPALACIVAGASFGADGLRLTATESVNPRFAGVITRESFAAPMRIDLVVRPLTQLRLVFGRHNQYLAFNERGEFVDVAPWFLRLDEEKGTRQCPQGGAAQPIGDEEWARVTIEVDERERRVLINGRLCHTWAGDFSGLRSRLAIGPIQSSVTVRALSVDLNPLHSRRS